MEKGEELVMNGAGVATDLVSGWLVASVVGSIWFGRNVLNAYAEQGANSVHDCSYGFDDSIEDGQWRDTVDWLFIVGIFLVAYIGMLSRRGGEMYGTAVGLGTVSIDLGVILMLLALAFVMHGSMTSYCTVGVIANTAAFSSPNSAYLLADTNATHGFVQTDGVSDDFSVNDYSIFSPSTDGDQRYFSPAEVFENLTMETMVGLVMSMLIASAIYRAADRTQKVRTSALNLTDFLLAYGRLALVAAALVIVVNDSFDDLSVFTTVGSNYKTNLSLAEGNSVPFTSVGTADVTIEYWGSDAPYSINGGRCLSSMMMNKNKPRSKFVDLAEKQFELIKIVNSFEFACDNQSDVSFTSHGFLTASDADAHCKNTYTNQVNDLTNNGALAVSHPAKSILTMNVTNMEANKPMRGYIISLVTFAAISALFKVCAMAYVVFKGDFSDQNEANLRENKLVYHSETVTDLFVDIGCSIVVFSAMMSTLMWSCQIYTFATDPSSITGEDQRGDVIQFWYASCYVYAIFALLENWYSITDRLPGHSLLIGLGGHMYDKLGSYM